MLVGTLPQDIKITGCTVFVDPFREEVEAEAKAEAEAAAQVRVYRVLHRSCNCVPAGALS